MAITLSKMAKANKEEVKQPESSGYQFKVIMFDVDRITFIGEEVFNTQAAYDRKIDEICQADGICFDGNTGEMFNLDNRFSFKNCCRL